MLQSSTRSDEIQVGIAGLGMAGRAFVPALRDHPGCRLVAIADADAAVRADAAEGLGVDAYPTLDAMLDRPSLDAVCVATPTQLHAANVLAALGAGKHVIVEKPMAITLAETAAMVEAAEAAARVLLVGHSHSFDAPIRAMRGIISGGELGRVRMINTWNFTDWVYRPRRPDELVTAAGGGVTYRQGAHQFDILRLLGGGLVDSVHAQTFDWDPGRSVVGAHMVFLRFAGGAGASAIYNGYGGLPGPELCGGVGEWGFPPSPKSAPACDAADPASAKRARATAAVRSGAPFQPHFGLTVVSCEGGDIRQTPDGLAIYTRDGRRNVALETGASPYDRVVAEFHDAVKGLAAPLHDGRWGAANLEVCVAAIRSADEGGVVRLHRQVAVQP